MTIRSINHVKETKTLYDLQLRYTLNASTFVQINQIAFTEQWKYWICTMTRKMRERKVSQKIADKERQNDSRFCMTLTGPFPCQMSNYCKPVPFWHVWRYWNRYARLLHKLLLTAAFCNTFSTPTKKNLQSKDFTYEDVWKWDLWQLYCFMSVHFSA